MTKTCRALPPLPLLRARWGGGAWWYVNHSACYDLKNGGCAEDNTHTEVLLSSGFLSPSSAGKSKSRFSVNTRVRTANWSTHTHTHPPTAEPVSLSHAAFLVVCFVCGETVSHLAGPQLEVFPFVVTVVGPQQRQDI